MPKLKIQKSYNRAIIVEAWLQGTRTEKELREAMQSYVFAMENGDMALMSYPETPVSRKASLEGYYKCEDCHVDISDMNRRSAPKARRCHNCARKRRNECDHLRHKSNYLLTAWTNKLNKFYYLICEGRLP